MMFHDCRTNLLNFSEIKPFLKNLKSKKCHTIGNAPSKQLQTHDSES